MLSFAETNAEVTSPNKIKITSLSTLLVGGKGLSKCCFESSESDTLQLKPVAITFFKVIIFPDIFAYDL